MYGLYKSSKGNIREVFVSTMCRTITSDFFASEDETKGDFVFKDYTIEVGGKNKKAKKSDFVIRDDIELPQKNIIPLWTVGFLY
jgi:hypothetical protein